MVSWKKKLEKEMERKEIDNKGRGPRTEGERIKNVRKRRDG